MGDIYTLYRKRPGGTYAELKETDTVYYGDTIKLSIGQLPARFTPGTFERYSQNLRLSLCFKTNMWNEAHTQGRLVEIYKYLYINTVGNETETVKGQEYEFTLTETALGTTDGASTNPYNGDYWNSQYDPHPARGLFYRSMQSQKGYDVTDNDYENTSYTDCYYTISVDCFLMAYLKDITGLYDKKSMRIDQDFEGARVGLSYERALSLDTYFRNTWYNNALDTTQTAAASMSGHECVCPKSHNLSLKRTEFKTSVSLDAATVTVADKTVDITQLGLAGFMVMKGDSIAYIDRTPVNTIPVVNPIYEAPWDFLNIGDDQVLSVILLEDSGVEQPKKVITVNGSGTVDVTGVNETTLDAGSIQISRVKYESGTFYPDAPADEKRQVYITNVLPTYDTSYNHITVKAKFRKYGDQAWAAEQSFTHNGTSYENVFLKYDGVNSFNPDDGYEVEIIVRDDYGEVKSYQRRIPALTTPDFATVFEAKGGDSNGTQTREFNMLWETTLSGGHCAIPVTPSSGKIRLLDVIVRGKRVRGGLYCSENMTSGTTYYLGVDNAGSIEDGNPFNVHGTSGIYDFYMLVIGSGEQAFVHIRGGGGYGIYLLKLVSNEWQWTTIASSVN